MSIDIREYLSSLDAMCPSYKPLFSSPSELPSPLISELFSLCSKFSLNPYTKYHSFHILQSLYSSTNSLYLYVSLLVSSKMYDKESLTISQIQSYCKISKHQINQLEAEVLTSPKSSLFEATLFEWFLAFVELCSFQINVSLKPEICRVACFFIDFLYEERNVLAAVPVGVVAAAVLKCTIEILTLSTQDYFCIQLLAQALHHDIESIEAVSKYVLKYAIGEDFYIQCNLA